MNVEEPGATSWAAATWSVPAAVVAWLVAALLVGLALPDAGETTFFLVAAVLAAVMAAGGTAVSRRGGARARGVGLGTFYAGLACTVVAVVVVLQ